MDREWLVRDLAIETSRRVPGLLLIGTIGSGKTALGSAIGDISAAAGVPTAVIDLDWLGWLTSKLTVGMSFTI
jgi:polynucleotide 5'-kinase involved in rRNA processing